MFGHWWHHLFSQIVILTESDFWHESPTLVIVYLTLAVFPIFVKLYVCCITVYLLHELDLLCHFFHILAKCIDDMNRKGRILNKIVKLGKVDTDRHIIYSVHRKLK